MMTKEIFPSIPIHRKIIYKLALKVECFGKASMAGKQVSVYQPTCKIFQEEHVKAAAAALLELDGPIKTCTDSFLGDFSSLNTSKLVHLVDSWKINEI